MATRNLGPIDWSVERDNEGYRTYKITFKIESDSGLDGPANVLQTPGLPIPGNYWEHFNDIDIYVWLRPDASVRRLNQDDGKGRFWTIEMTYSNKPDSSQKKCSDETIDDPLLEPQEISGDFIKYTEEATHDRFGNPIVNSAHEQIRGPQVEFDSNRSQIKIKQNVPLLEIELFGPMVDTLNDAPLWGLPARCIKLSSAPWERKFHGQCQVYYTRTLTFDTFAKKDANGDLVSGFDRELLDEGTKVLRGDWDRDPDSVTYTDYVVVDGADPSNPSDFIRFKDWNGENSRVILDGAGMPVDTGLGTSTGGPSASEPGIIRVEKYGESNFLLLGIPTTF